MAEENVIEEEEEGDGEEGDLDEDYETEEEDDDWMIFSEYLAIIGFLSTVNTFHSSSKL